MVSAAALTTTDPLPTALAKAVTGDLRQVGLLDALTADFFRHHPRAGVSWLVLVDGLDEISDTDTRSAVLTMLAGAAAAGRGLYRFVVATRPLPAEELSTPGQDLSCKPEVNLVGIGGRGLGGLSERGPHRGRRAGRALQHAARGAARARRGSRSPRASSGIALRSRQHEAPGLPGVSCAPTPGRRVTASAVVHAAAASHSGGRPCGKRSGMWAGFPRASSRSPTRAVSLVMPGHGWRVIRPACGPCAARAVPVNAVSSPASMTTAGPGRAAFWVMPVG